MQICEGETKNAGICARRSMVDCCLDLQITLISAPDFSIHFTCWVCTTLFRRRRVIRQLVQLPYRSITSSTPIGRLGLTVQLHTSMDGFNTCPM
ncbi:hypothetical protein PEX1_012770 [Penicillium expansum]|uniref:Uncharacterized protein n=1 Tax=Penicillium expansum TaxID=27334 RepID=A0A0A2KC30_PENEN|nr:hypothetical protein PEX2_014160 [Penicillium expansum]KGO41944.1 hypothetical protein PEX1_012770 [Penicillium expansum]KGO47875.1 hypothetical protein PEXP_015680 [Penicillium expansum]KGO61920.1 hypothetical protein PEX2_014160 [Penicillium expansum]